MHVLLVQTKIGRNSSVLITKFLSKLSFHLSFFHFANTCFTLFICSILFCLLVQRREMQGKLYARVCTRLHHFGADIEKTPYRGRGDSTPPSHTLPPLGRYAPSGLVASLPRKIIRNFEIQMLGGLLKLTN